MPNHALPNRAAPCIGPQRPVYCDASAEALTRFIGALDEWEPPIGVAIDTAGSGLEPNAIGVVRWDTTVEGASTAAELKQIAAEHNYFLIEVVMFDLGSRAAELLLSQHIGDAESVAVLTPSIEHVGELKRAITLVCDLVTPEQVYPCGHQWPPTLTIVDGGR
ncbi:hypothetical protein ACQPZ2_04850 [Nocardia pseudovaccinii]|uniref:hypothetical protein n=1 Tax=Nocardia pseudovaccinii TaxID=189540 RepID=UPI003D8B128D